MDPNEKLDQLNRDFLAEDLLTTRGNEVGRSGADEIRAGRPLERFGTRWDEVREQLDTQVPNHGMDEQQARDIYENSRNTRFRGQLVRGPGQGQGERNELNNFLDYVPIAGSINRIVQGGREKEVRDRIQSGQASQEDYAAYQSRLRDEQYQQDRGLAQQAGEGIGRVPSFVAEMGMGGVFGRAASAGTTARLGGGLGARAVGWGAGSVVTAAAMPASATASVFRRINPHVGEADATVGDVFRGLLDHQIEVASERLGGPIEAAAGLAGRAARPLISKLPSAVRSNAVLNGLGRWAVGRYRGTQGFRDQLNRVGMDGLLGEFMEERFGDVARGATGVEEDYGSAGTIAALFGGDTQRFMQGLDELAVEGMVLGGFQSLLGGLGAATRANERRSFPRRGTDAYQETSSVFRSALEMSSNPAAFFEANANLASHLGITREFVSQAQQNAEARNNPTREAFANADLPESVAQLEGRDGSEQGQLPLQPGQEVGALDPNAPLTPREAPLAAEQQAQEVRNEAQNRQQGVSEQQSQPTAPQNGPQAAQEGVPAQQAQTPVQASPAAPSKPQAANSGRSYPAAVVDMARLTPGTANHKAAAFAVGEALAAAIANPATNTAFPGWFVQSIAERAEEERTPERLKKIASDFAKMVKAAGNPKEYNPKTFMPPKGSRFQRELVHRLQAEAAKGASLVKDSSRPELPKLSPGQQRMVDARSRTDPAAAEFMQNEFNRKNVGDTTVYAEVMKYGGISEYSVRHAFGNSQAELDILKETFPAELFQKKGGVRLDDLLGGEVGTKLFGISSGDGNDTALIDRAQQFFDRMADHFVVEGTAWLELQENMDQWDAWRNDHAERFREKFPDATDEEIARDFERQRLDSETDGARESSNKSAGQVILEETGDAYEGSGSNEDADFDPRTLSAMAQGRQSEADRAGVGQGSSNRAETGPGGSAVPGQAGRSATDRLSRFAGQKRVTQKPAREWKFREDIHPFAVSVMQSAQRSLGQMPADLAEHFEQTLAAVLSNMTPQAVAMVASEQPMFRFHESIDNLTGKVGEEFPEVLDALRETGVHLGGAVITYDSGLAALHLDGGSELHRGTRPRETAAQIYAHELGHIIDNGLQRMSQSDAFMAAFRAEIDLDTNPISEYARTDAGEGFAEFVRIWNTADGEGRSAIAAKLPQTYALMAGAGIVEQVRPEAVAFQAAEVFEERVPLGKDNGHADAVLQAMVSPGQQDAMDLVAPTGLKPSAIAYTAAEQVADYAVDHLAPAVRYEQARVKAGMKRASAGWDMRTILANVGWLNGQTLADFWENGIARLLPDGYKERISEAPEHITDGFAAADVAATKDGGSWLGTFMVADHLVREARRGALLLTSKDPRLQAKGKEKTTLVTAEQLTTYRKFLEESKRQDPARHAKAMAARKRYTAILEACNQAMVASGWLTEQDAQNMREDKPDYVPIVREHEETDKPESKSGLMGRQTIGVKRKGSASRIVDPFVSLRARIALTAHIVNRQLVTNELYRSGDYKGVDGQWEKSDAPPITAADRQNFYAAMEAMGIDYFTAVGMAQTIDRSVLNSFTKVPWKSGGGNTLSIRFLGKVVHLAIHDKGLYDLLTSQQGDDSSIVTLARTLAAIPGLAKANQALKWGAVVASTVFPVRNMLRDPWNYFQNAKREGRGYLESLTSLMVSAKEAYRAKWQNMRGREVTDTIAKVYFGAKGEGNRAFSFNKNEESASYNRMVRNDGGRVGAAVRKIRNVEDMLEMWGAFEHAGRMSEFEAALKDMGFTRDKIETAMRTSPELSPIPLDAMFYASMRAARATTDFSHVGVGVREANKTFPFLGPHLAGLGQELRNWAAAGREAKAGRFGNASKAMMVPLAAFLAYEILHWFTFKDDEWYNELGDRERYGYWILGQDANGGVWGVPKPHGILPMVGAHFQEMMRTIGGQNPRQGMALGFSANSMVPRMTPIGVGESVAVFRNRAWHGGPIVPRSGLGLPEWEQFKQYQLPYMMEQLSGGFLSGRVFRGPWEAFHVSKTAPQQSIRDVYSAADELRRASALHEQNNPGRPFPGAGQLRALTAATRRLSEIGRAIRVAKQPAEEVRLRREQLRLAQQTLKNARQETSNDRQGSSRSSSRR